MTISSAITDKAIDWGEYLKNKAIAAMMAIGAAAWSALSEGAKVAEAGLKAKAEILLEVVRANPFQNPPPYEKLSGDLKGLYSRRINIQHRLMYAVYSDIKTLKVLRMWTHYE